MKSLITEFLAQEYPDHQVREIRWCKRVTGLDKSCFNGYSLQGEFIDLEEDSQPIEPGIYFAMAYVRMTFLYCRFPKHRFEEWNEINFNPGLEDIFHKTYLGIGVLSGEDSKILFHKETSKHSTWAKKFWKILEPLLQSQPNAEKRVKFLQAQLLELKTKLQDIEKLLEVAKLEEADKELTEWLKTAAVLGSKHKN